MAGLIRRRGVRIVHGTDFVTNFLGLLAARLAGARMVVSRVDLGHERPGFGPLRRRVEKSILPGNQVRRGRAAARRDWRPCRRHGEDPLDGGR